ncbi:MAG: SpoVR family protein [Desulfobacterales bacterium]|nr:SpoVR family protein [Desulfobacterales bacterium]
MELIDQKTKKIMEGCKKRARDVGLNFLDDSLEYIVTNRDMIELSPKVMIPTLYDYWVHDVEVLKGKGKYELYPSNPYETVINTRPAISFYNDNNPDWLNVMIFYHVLAHIDFFQNNLYFRHTWDYDFTARALSDKRAVAMLRAEKGRWVDYVIEFTRGIDNLVGYHGELSRLNQSANNRCSSRLDYYFDVFLQAEKEVRIGEYLKEVELYNAAMSEFEDVGEQSFFADVAKKYPEFDALYKKNLQKKPDEGLDLVQYLMENSIFLNKEENVWMKTIMEVVRNTSLVFQPQIRTKILNEGWASYWHEHLFLKDDRIGGHEVDFSRVNAGVTSLPRVGLNPYALGMRMFYDIEERADKGQYTFDFERILGAESREKYDKKTGSGRDFIFKIRENFCDFMFINTFVDQDFVSKYKIFVAGKRLNQQRMTWEYYVKSRKAKDYRQMLFDSLYHPPHITIDLQKCLNGVLYLVHHYEGKPLVRDFIPNTMLGIEYLWDGLVKLETTEVESITPPRTPPVPGQPPEEFRKEDIMWHRVLYTMQHRKLTRRVLKRLGNKPEG